VLTAENVMRRTLTVATHKDGPNHAVRLMRQTGISSIFVVDQRRRFLGLVTVDDALAAARQKAKSLEGILQQDLPSVAPDTLLGDMIPLASNQKAPIAVVDDAGRLLGIVTRAALLDGLSSETEDEP